MSRTSHQPRLAVVSDSVHPWKTGGKEVRHHELLRRLAARGVDVHVFTTKWWEGPATTTCDGITFHGICRSRALYAGARRSIPQALLFALSTWRLLFHRFDVVEVDAIPFLPLFPMRVVCWLKRRRMVVTWHEYWGASYWTDYLGSPGRLAAWIERRAILLPDLIIAASQGTADRLRGATPRSVAVSVIPNGVRQVSFSAPSASPGSSPASQLALISVGRLLSHKNVDLALRATALLRDRGEEVRLRVVGEGPEAGRLHELASELALGDRVVFSPFVDSHDDLLALVADSDVLLFPSVREGFGMVALEAMSVGTPVVTADHPDNFARHLVTPGVNGEWCAPGAASLADAVTRVAQGHRDMAVAARRTAMDYNWDNLAGKAALAYEIDVTLSTYLQRDSGHLSSVNTTAL